jgi:hypothetical protein
MHHNENHTCFHTNRQLNIDSGRKVYSLCSLWFPFFSSLVVTELKGNRMATTRTAKRLPFYSCMHPFSILLRPCGFNIWQLNG